MFFIYRFKSQISIFLKDFSFWWFYVYRFSCSCFLIDQSFHLKNTFIFYFKLKNWVGSLGLALFSANLLLITYVSFSISLSFNAIIFSFISPSLVSLSSSLFSFLSFFYFIQNAILPSSSYFLTQPSTFISFSCPTLVSLIACDLLLRNFSCCHFFWENIYACELILNH